MRNILSLLALFLVTGSSLVEFPEARISNGLIDAHIYLPDPATGYYRGARFDWAGVVSDLKYKDHTYFGQWFEHYSPTLHDAIMGPVEAFDPIGYDEAKAGESFMKIGIGTLAKPDEPRYYFATPYQILDPGKWKVRKKADQVEFVHQHEWKEYAYVYTKTLQLTKGKPGLVLLHSLMNTGKRVIETSVFNHNFFVIDQQPTGPDFRITFPFTLSGESKSPADLGEIQGNRIVYKRVLNKGENLFFSPLLGFRDTAKDNEVTIENVKTGAGVKITCDLPISRLVFWSASATVCPEPYSKIKVNPGEAMTWRNTYQFYSLEPGN